MLTLNQLEQLFKNLRDADEWHSELLKQLPKYQIDTPKRIAGFLSQCGHESANFTRLEENLNYSESALNRVFGKYFGKKRNARSYARNPERIANVVYANRMGNGSIRSGDGWKYRGRGIIQLTGKNNYQAFGDSVGMSPDEVIDYVQTKEGAIRAACWYWDTNNLNRFSDRSDVVGLTRRINGGTNGLKHRTYLWNKALRILETRQTSSRGQVNRRIISSGDVGSDVKVIQRFLGLTPDGIFGPITKRAVRVWQNRNGLVPDGVVGPKTTAAMGL